MDTENGRAMRRVTLTPFDSRFEHDAVDARNGDRSMARRAEGRVLDPALERGTILRRSYTSRLERRHVGSSGIIDHYLDGDANG